MDKVVGNLNSTILNIKDGKGALNYLSNDPKLVQEDRFNDDQYQRSQFPFKRKYGSFKT